MSKKITAMTEKTVLIDADLLEIVDSADATASNKNKKVTAANLKTYVSDGITNIIYDLSNWNMVTTSGQNIPIVALGVTDLSKVLSLNVIIFDDAGTLASPIGVTDTLTSSPMYPNGTAYLSDTFIHLLRLDGGIFDSTNYDGTGLRARVHITLIA